MAHTSLSVPKAKTGMLVLSILMILSLVLAACGGTGANNKQNSDTLTILANNSGNYPKNFNPYDQANVISGTPGLIYETLLEYNRLDGTIKPWLATSYQFSSDATSLTFTLQKRVQWSDGQPFTSDDIVFTLNLLKKYPALDVLGETPFIKTVTAPDAYTVKVTLTRPFSPLLWFLGGQTFILARHTWSKVKGDPSQYADPNPVGTGPYALKSFTPQLVVLSRNPRFRVPGKPVVTTIKIPAFDSNTSAELALVLLYVLGSQLNWFPIHGGYDTDNTSPGWNLDFILSAAQYAILPALTIIIGSLAGWMLGMRNAMVTTLAEDYVLMAEAKGLPTRKVMFSYAARNAVLPNVTAFALSLGFVVSGSLLTEIVFSYPGIGYDTLQAIDNLDYALLQGIFLVITVAVLGANFLADLLYVMLDPRVRTGRG